MPAELIFFLIIIALSLLSNLAKAPARPPPQVPPRPPDGAGPGQAREPEPRAVDGGRAVPPATWLPGPAAPRGPLPVPWDDEEGPEEEERPPLEVVPAFESVSLEPAARADDVAPRPEPVRPVLETPDVDREAEHARLHRILAGGQAAPAHARGTLAALRGPGALRRAVLAAEVLGPPLALRPPDER